MREALRHRPAPSIPSGTVSICASDDEASRVKDAASNARMTPSAWSAARVVEALSTAKDRAETLAFADRVAQTELPKGARSGRISMVLQVHFQDQLKAIKEATRISPHAFMQAAIFAAAEAAVDAMPPGHRAGIEKANRTRFQMALVPVRMKDVDAIGLTENINALLRGTVEALRHDRGVAIAKGAPAMAQRAADAGEMVAIKLFVPDFELRAVAFVLGIDHNLLLTALAMKAAKLRT